MHHSPPEHLLATLLGVGLLVAPLLASPVPAAATAIEPGDAAPSFYLPTLAGDRFVSADSLLGGAQPTLLLFWNTACPDCLGDLAATAARSIEDDSTSLRLVGICTELEGIGDARRFARELELPFLNLWDRRRSAAAGYGVTEVSFAAVLVDARGVIRLAHHGHHEAIGELLDTIWLRAAGTEAPPIPDESKHD